MNPPRLHRVALMMVLLACPVARSQGIRGVTRRTPTVVHGQTASQFFTAGGVPLNATTNVGPIPGSPQAGGAAVAGRTVRGPVSPNLAGRPMPIASPSVPATTPAPRTPAKPASR